LLVPAFLLAETERVAGLVSREQIPAHLSAWQDHDVRTKLAGLVPRAEDWQSGSFNHRLHKPE